MDSYSDKKLINVVRNEKRNGIEKSHVVSHNNNGVVGYFS